MSEVCALEIMEKNEMIKVKDTEFSFLFVKEKDATEPISKIIVPAKNIKILQKGGDFDKKFRELMKDSGYTCMPRRGYSGSNLFFRTEDIDDFLDNLPHEEVIYTRPFPTVMERYINKIKDDRNLIIKNSVRVMIDDFFAKEKNGEWGYQTKIKQCDIIKERVDEEKRQEQQAIEFMEQLF